MQPSPVCRKHILVGGEEYVYKYMYKVRTNTKKILGEGKKQKNNYSIYALAIILLPKCFIQMIINENKL
jgi:hypothetical protein